MMKCTLSIPTSDGVFQADYSQSKLTAIRFPSDRGGEDDRASQETMEYHQITISAVQAILSGKVPDRFPPFELLTCSPFQRAVWAELVLIPKGETATYGEIANRVGQPGGARAVGNACGANPIPLVIPCHRVVAAAGKLGGFSGGLPWKRLLLGREGVSTDRRDSRPTEKMHGEFLNF